MNGTTHHIRKQVLDFQFSERFRAVQWQRKISARYRQEYLNAIASVFDEHEDGSRYLIDTMELDLGSVSEEELVSRIKTELRKALVDRLRKKSGILPYNKTERTQNGRIRKVATDEKLELFSIFTFFLGNGYLPWGADQLSVALLEKQLKEKWPLTDLTGRLVAANLLHKKRERTRLYHQFSSSFATEIIVGYWQRECANLETIYEFLETRLREAITDRFSPFRVTSREKVSIIRWVAVEAGPNPRQWPTEFAGWYLIKRLEKKKSGPKQLISNLINELGRDHRTTAEIISKLDTIILGIVEYGTGKDHGNLASKDSITPSDIDGVQETYNRSEAIEKPTSEKKNIMERLSTSKKRLEHGHKSHENLTTPDLPENRETRSKKKEDTGKTVSNDAEKFEEKNKLSEIGGYGSLKDFVRKGNRLEGEAEERTAKRKPKTTEQQSLEEGADIEQTHPKAKPIRGKQAENPELKDRDADRHAMAQTTRNVRVKELENLEWETASEGYYLTDAGLVLSWPYLTQLFEKLGYTEQKIFVSKKQRERAVLLLGFIATGKALCEEPQLILSKFLCGWPIQMPVAKDITLSKKEQKEAMAMLEALIRNWKVLKKTSIDGLRETFFSRDGKLVDEEEYWKLTVEQKGTDILLDHLPYGLSIIKLPWFKKMLKVDWA
ncbi:MAG: contractile injection system tape measure protein [Pricia sp.]